MRAGLGFVWGFFRLGKGLISRMLLGGFNVDFETVWVGLELICARCAARFCSSFWAASERWLRKFWAGLGGLRQRRGFKSPNHKSEAQLRARLFCGIALTPLKSQASVSC